MRKRVTVDSRSYEDENEAREEEEEEEEEVRRQILDT